MKIEPDEKAAVRQWLASRGETAEGLSLHAWVSALDPAPCKGRLGLWDWAPSELSTIAATT